MSQGRKRCQAACKKKQGQYHPVISSFKQVHTWAHTHAQTQSLSIWNVWLTRCMVRTTPALRPLARRTTIRFDSHTHTCTHRSFYVYLVDGDLKKISITRREGLNLFHREIKKALVNTRGPKLVISSPNMNMHQSKRGQYFISFVHTFIESLISLLLTILFICANPDWCITLKGSWISEISRLKFCSSILPSSNLKYFQSVLILSDQSCHWVLIIASCS